MPATTCQHERDSSDTDHGLIFALVAIHTANNGGYCNGVRFDGLFPSSEILEACAKEACRHFMVKHEDTEINRVKALRMRAILSLKYKEYAQAHWSGHDGIQRLKIKFDNTVEMLRARAHTSLAYACMPGQM